MTRFHSRRRSVPLAWVIDDLRAIVALLRQPETWIFIGLAVVFAALGGVSLYYLTGLDPSRTLRHIQSFTCASTGNLFAAALIVGGVAFAVAAIAAFGELATYVDDKRRYRRRPSVRTALIVTAIAIVCGAGLVGALLAICG